MKRKLISSIMVIALLLTMIPAMAASRLSKCPFCGSTNFDQSGYTEPTCTQKGSVRIYCSCSNYSGRTYTVKALGHKWGEWKTVKAATCQKEGERKHTCQRCGATKTEKTDRKAHSYGAWTVATPPTDHSAGVRRRTCKTCKHADTQNFYPDGTLRRGAGNDRQAVKELQSDLNDAGYDCGTPDGDFGRKTEDAVKRFQQDKGLNADGIGWPQTLALLGGKPIEPTAADGAALSLTVRQTSPVQAAYRFDDCAEYAIGLYNTGSVVLTHPRVEMYRESVDADMFDYAYNTDPTNPDGGTIGPGESHLTESGYWFTEEDEKSTSGKLRLIFRAVGEQPDGTSVYSDPIAFDYDMSSADASSAVSPAAPESTDIEFTKREASHSADPRGYLAGETVTYELSVRNKGRETLTDVEIFDPMKGSYEDGVVALGVTVLPGETQLFEFTYTVKPGDIPFGSCTNIAKVTWWDKGGTQVTLLSNAVTVTLYDPASTPMIGDDPTDDDSTDDDSTDEVKTPAPAVDCCSRSLKFMSEYDEEYLLHFCAEHDPIRRTIAESVDAAKTDDEKLAAWQQGRRLWQQQLDAMYDACAADADAEGKAVVADERETFSAYMADLEAEFTLIWPDAPVYVGEKLAEVLMNKVADMCCLMSTAPADRADSYFTGDYRSIEGLSMDYDNCTFEITKDAGSDVSYLCTCCASHFENDCEALSYVFSEKDTAAAFTEATELWFDMLDGCYRRLYEGRSGDARAIISGESKRFGDRVEAYRAFLRLFYPKKPETVAEMIYQEVRTKCMTLCGMTGSVI